MKLLYKNHPMGLEVIVRKDSRYVAILLDRSADASSTLRTVQHLIERLKETDAI